MGKEKSTGWIDNVKSPIIETISKHPNFFVAFSSFLIIITGIGIANGKENWWVSSVAILGFFLMVFVLINARVMIKATLAFLLTTLVANFSLQAGMLLDPYSTIGLVWLATQLFLFFFTLAISYLSIGYKSRWTAALFGQIASFMLSALYLDLMNSYVALVLGSLSGLAVFFLYYKGMGHISFRKTAMPENVMSDKISEAFERETESSEWNVRQIVTTGLFNKEPVSDYLVWNRSHAFVLHPVQLSGKFGVSPGRRGSKLMHNGNSINPWLLYLVNKRLPLWRSKNAPMMLVLLDIDNKNGGSPEAIGVSIPDTKKKIPVGIYPARGFISGGSKKSNGVFDDIEEKYEQYVGTISNKHYEALSEIGSDDNSEYLEEEEIKSTSDSI